MEAIVEKSVNGRTIHVYEVEIEYQLVRASEQAAFESALKEGRAADIPNVLNGAYIRLFDVEDVHSAITESIKKFDAFVQGQACLIKRQVVRRCDLKFRGHAF